MRRERKRERESDKNQGWGLTGTNGEHVTCKRIDSRWRSGLYMVYYAPAFFNELSLSLDYRTRGFDVVTGSNESIDTPTN